MVRGKPLLVFGEPDSRTRAQIVRCLEDPRAVAGVLCADAHVGYAMPVGGVVAYREAVSIEGVGVDIACGIKAVRTDADWHAIAPRLPVILDDIARHVSFGIGRSNPTPIDHPLFDDPVWREIKPLAALRRMAEEQLGTVGGGNHFVDLLLDEEERVWIAAHFGSRGLGFRIAKGFLALAHGRSFDSVIPEDIDRKPTVLDLTTQLAQDYWRAMTLAGAYAYAGRDYVVEQVRRILGAAILEVVHNHHNFAWREEWQGETLIVVRKGATPAFPGQRGFVGGSMADHAAIVEGQATPENEQALHSTVHGAGRILSRREAKGKLRKGKVIRPGRVSRAMMEEANRRFGVLVRGGDVDESAHVYRKLRPVLAAHLGSIEVVRWLRPVGVVMAGPDIADPYKD